ncbi:MAG TPA: MYXO-CTERM sorting domain-containing protein, partial [Enhygromyxa sp.]|nr:MYXO-CTERM sorting domain-containing protein [Enhygromyxa sp.]
DPCPEPALTLTELVTLGADVLPSYERVLGKRKVDESYTWSVPGEFVLTRLHARYDAGSLGEDLVFQAAPAIVGGREFLQQDGQLERGAIESPGGYNNFQARYAIRHEWPGPIECDSPQRGIWGGPWPDVQDQDGQPKVARDLAFVARDVELAGMVTEQAKLELEQTVGALPTGPIAAPQPGTSTGGSDDGGGGGCAHCSAGSSAPAGLLGLGLLGLLGVYLRRRR